MALSIEGDVLIHMVIKVSSALSFTHMPGHMLKPIGQACPPPPNDGPLQADGQFCSSRSRLATSSSYSGGQLPPSASPPPLAITLIGVFQLKSRVNKTSNKASLSGFHSHTGTPRHNRRGLGQARPCAHPIHGVPRICQPLSGSRQTPLPHHSQYPRSQRTPSITVW